MRAEAGVAVVERCPLCGRWLAVRKRKRDGGVFIGCSGWPKCDFTSGYDEREQALAQTITRLERRLSAVEEELGVVKNAAVAPWVADKLRDMIVMFHPDKRPEGLTAHEVVSELNALRDSVMGEMPL